MPKGSRQQRASQKQNKTVLESGYTLLSILLLAGFNYKTGQQNVGVRPV